MPDVSLNAADAAELAEMLQFLTEWLARDPARLAASLAAFVGHPAYGLDDCTATWSGSSSCSAAATASPCSACPMNSPSGDLIRQGSGELGTRRPAAGRPRGTEASGMLTSMEERELHFPVEQPLIGWRLFRVRRSGSGFVLSAPLIHNPDFEHFPSPTINAICYQAEHPAPAPGCRCGLYAAIDGTLDSLSGYLSDSAHDRDPPIYSQVACTGRVFVDLRGVRAQRIKILRLAPSAPLWPDPGLPAQAVAGTPTAILRRGLWS
jgi:hypothetical protein